LHQELEPHGVAVTALCPGMSATSFGEVAGQALSPILKMMIMEPQPVVKAGLLAMLGGKTTVIPGFFNKAAVFLNRLMPLRTPCLSTRGRSAGSTNSLTVTHSGLPGRP